MKARIHLVAGPASGRVVAMEGQQRIVIGRGSDATVSIPEDTALSRKHLELELDTLRMQLHARDLGSRHGVFVNGERADSRLLVNGDRVQAGDTVARVEIVHEAMAPTLMATSPSMPATSGLVVIRCRCGVQFTGPAPDGDEVVFLCPTCQGELERAPAMPPDHELVRVLGRGAMGCVFLVRHANGERRAIKQILPKAAMSAQMRKMFAREAAVQATLDHPNIVRVHGLVEAEPGSFSLIMEYVDGASAESLLDHGGAATPELAVAIGCQALDGLAHAHARQIIHRDVKEGNLMLARASTGDVVVKVADFGLAKNFHESGASGMTNDGALGGTLAYMPKEQLLDFRYVKPPADVYALGATLYRLLTAEYPRDYAAGDNWIRITLEQPIVPLRGRARGRDLPVALCRVIEKALEPEVANRYQTAAEMRRALAASQ